MAEERIIRPIFEGSIADFSMTPQAQVSGMLRAPDGSAANLYHPFAWPPRLLLIEYAAFSFEFVIGHWTDREHVRTAAKAAV